MGVALQIHDVPEQVRGALEEEARRQGQSLQVYLLALVEREAHLLRKTAAFERTRSMRVSLPVEPTSVIREGRDGGFDVDRATAP